MSTPNQARTPDQLLRIFSQSRFLFGIVVAVVLHLVLIAVTSVGYLRDRVIDPEGAAARKQAAEMATATPAPEATPDAAATPAPAPAAMAVASPTVAPPAPAPEPGSDEAIMKERAGSPVIQSITETASPGEIPKEPGDEGLSLEATNPGR